MLRDLKIKLTNLLLMLAVRRAVQGAIASEPKAGAKVEKLPASTPDYPQFSVAMVCSKRHEQTRDRSACTRFAERGQPGSPSPACVALRAVYQPVLVSVNDKGWNLPGSGDRRMQQHVQRFVRLHTLLWQHKLCFVALPESRYTMVHWYTYRSSGMRNPQNAIHNRWRECPVDP